MEENCMKLNQLQVFFLDLQTTGAKPESGNILEIAWCDSLSPIVSHLVEQPELAEIPRRISMITGVKNSDMESATPFPKVLNELQMFIENKSHAVIHFAQFEKPFLSAAFSRFSESIPFPIICTHEIAKRLYPNLPSRGIKGLAGFFGDSTGEFKRAPHHVNATKMIWEKLIEALAEKNVHTIDELSAWLAETPKAAREKYEYPLPKEKRLNLPDVPGIYRMLNSKGEVLYVGKATSLFSRVNSYFRGQKGRNSFKLEMLTQVYDLRVTECSSPLEAALLETDEIKRLNPYYNIALKVIGRSLVFFNHDFSSMNDCADEVHTVGPFSNVQTILPMLKLMTYARLSESILLPDENTFYEPLPPELIKAGLDLFCERHDHDLSFFMNMRKIMAQGLIWDHQLRMLEEEIEEDVEEDIEVESEDETEVELTAEDIADKIERHVMRVGKSYIRARRFETIMNSEITYREKKGPEYKLQLKNGQLGKSVDSHPWSTSPIETYDRLTVLLTELDRVKKQGGNYKIIFRKDQEDFQLNQ
jgi:DNA polymerase-3 subunit epsilon